MNTVTTRDGREPGATTEAGGTEGGRPRPTGVPPASVNEKKPDPEVDISHKRRNLTEKFKRKVVAKVLRLRSQGFGAVGAYLRSIGIYYSSAKQWERQIRTGTLGKKRGQKEQSRTVLLKEVHRLRRQVEETERKLKQSELIIDLQKKISDMAALALPQNFERSR